MHPIPHRAFPRHADLSTSTNLNLNIAEQLFPRDSCVSCDSTPSCNCSAGEQCILTSRTCNQCPTIQCIKSSSSSSSSTNPGVIAGPVVAVLVIASLGLFWWMRRKKRRDLARLEELASRARKAEQAGFQLSQPGSPTPGSASSHSGSHRQSFLPVPPTSARRSPLPPAPVNAEYYDENGATIRVYNGNVGTINLDPRSAAAGGGDPFSDRQSISTMGSGGTANIIPIQYIPPSKSDEALSAIKPSDAAGGPGQSAAARLNAARQNLFAPRRPARSPDLDLRLNPNVNGANDSATAGPSAFHPRSPALSSNIRDSYLSGNSAAPSYWSGQSDVHLDAPKIVTSKQVQIGRLQQAEMVQFGGGGGKGPQIMELIGQSSLSPVRDEEQSDPFKNLTAQGLGEGSVRTLTPNSNRTAPEYDDEEEGLRTGSEPSSAGAGDLRFSMGSLAYRDSVSTMGTSRYLASAISPGYGASPQKGYANLPPPPRPAAQAGANGNGGEGERESMFSTKSYADSVLGAFPMIPPGAAAGAGGEGRPPLPTHPSMPGLGLPQSTSIATLDHVAAPLSRPPPTYRPPAGVGGGESRRSANPNSQPRPITQASMAPSDADSLLGSYPFVPPNMDDLAELPSAALPTAAAPPTGSGGASAQ